MDLCWKAMPMRAAKGDKQPYLGQGVYMHVVETFGGNPKLHYIGKSQNLGKRWREHVLDWYVYPHEGYSIPESVENYLTDPIDVINNGALAQCLPNRAEVMRAILKHTWFCWAEVDAPARLGDVEYVLQQGANLHLGIEARGFIGDVRNVARPNDALVIANNLPRPLLVHVLPTTIAFDPVAGLTIA